MTTVTFMPFRMPAASSALSAWTMTTSPPFMSMMPGPLAVRVVDPLEFLEGAVRREHRVEVADEHELRTGGRVDGHEVTGAMPRGAVHPLGLEAEAVELGAEDPADLAHAVEVLGAAVDVHDALEERQGVAVVRVRISGDRPFGRAARLHGENGGQRAGREKMRRHGDYYYPELIGDLT